MTTLEKIRAELEHWKPDGVQDDFESGALYMRDYALMIIEKYASEECDRDCEHCVYLECPIEPSKAKQGRCKECKYFEYDSVANVDGVPLIVAHEICSKWGDGCKTSENGYCFMFEPKTECDHPDKCHECEKILTCTYYKENK